MRGDWRSQHFHRSSMAEAAQRRAYIVHRARIGDHVPSAIKTAAAGLLRGRNVVAIGREDGQIEVSCCVAVLRLAGGWVCL